jgi:hypothetical protein
MCISESTFALMRARASDSRSFYCGCIRHNDATGPREYENYRVGHRPEVNPRGIAHNIDVSEVKFSIVDNNFHRVRAVTPTKFRGGNTAMMNDPRRVYLVNGKVSLIDEQGNHGFQWTDEGENEWNDYNNQHDMDEKAHIFE